MSTLVTASGASWYIAESDRGWLIDDSKPCVSVERTDGRMALRLKLVDKPSLLKTARTVNFSLFAMPNQPNPAHWRRRMWDGGDGTGELDLERSTWFNTGWRRYGWGADDFYLPSDKDYEELGDFLHYPERFDMRSKHPGAKWAQNFLLGKKKSYGEKYFLEKAPVVLYSSHHAISASLPECETYSGEWFGDNNLVADLNAHPGAGSEVGTYTTSWGNGYATSPPNAPR